MNPVIGLDVAKGESQVQAYLDKKKPYKRSFKVKHTLEGLVVYLDFIKEIEDIRGTTSCYIGINRALSAPVVQYFEDRGYLLIIVNPLISYQGKKF